MMKKVGAGLPLQLRVDDHRGEHQAPVSGLVEGHEQPLPSIEPDTIDTWLSQQHVALFYWSDEVFERRLVEG
jgi:hypothetical protein